MITKILYRYNKGDATIDSPILPEGQTEYTERYRLIADQDKVLTKDDEKFCTVIDIDQSDLELWHEVDKPKEEESSQTYKMRRRAE